MVLDSTWNTERGETLRHALSSSPVGARLRNFSKKWDLLGSNWASSIIRGYRIPIMGRPFIPKGLPEFYGSMDQHALIDDHVGELLKKDAVMRVSTQEGADGFTSPLLLVKKKSGKFRPCLDLRHINANIPYQKFQLEGIKQLKHMLREGDFMTSIDLQDGYLHVPIAEESQKLLQFRWRSQYYRFRALPFGLSSAPWVFTKLLRPVLRKARSQGIRLLVYLDDFIILGSSLKECWRNTEIVLQLLTDLGFLVNREKSSLTPSTAIEFLGFIIDTAKMKFFVPAQKRKRYRNACARLLKKLSQGALVRLRTFASIAGKLRSLSPAVPFSGLHLQEITEIVREYTKSRKSECVLWDSYIRVTNQAQEELRWWVQWLRGWKGHAIIPDQASVDLFSDASELGYGGLMETWKGKCKQVVQGYWSSSESQRSSNWREITAAKRVVLGFLRWRDLRQCTVRLFTDNIVTYYYLGKMGGRHTHLSRVASTLLHKCEEREVTLIVEHVPGELNYGADRLSRIPLDRSEWQLNRNVFKHLDFMWGPHTVDWFATRNNNLLPRFATWTLDDRAVYVDALEHLAKKENGFAHPPFSIIGKVLQRLERSTRDLTIIVPAWPSQYWWPRLLHLLSEVPVLLPDLENLLVPPRGSAVLAKRVPWRMLACRISGRSSKRKAFRRRLRKYSAIGGLRLLKEIMGYFGEDGECSAAAKEATCSILANLMS